MGNAAEILQADNWMTVDELATVIGIHRKSVYAMIQRGEVPGVRKLAPKVIRIYRPDVVAWLAGQDVEKRSRRRR